MGQEKWPSHIKLMLCLAVLPIISGFYGNYLSREQIRLMQAKSVTPTQTADASRSNSSPQESESVNYTQKLLLFSTLSPMIGSAMLLVAVFVAFRRRPHGEEPLGTMETGVVNFEDQARGYELQSALFGAPHHPASDVTRKVKQLVASGRKSIPVSWSLLLGRDPVPDVLKSLVLTFSITSSEGKEIFLPDPVPGECQRKLQVAETALEDCNGKLKMLGEELVKQQDKQKPDDLTGIDESLINRVRQRFALSANLRWQHRLALHILWRSADQALSPSAWRFQIQNHGYTEDQAKEIVRSLVVGSIMLDMNYHGDPDTALQSADTEISFKPYVARILGRLFMENPLC